MAAVSSLIICFVSSSFYYLPADAATISRQHQEESVQNHALMRREQAAQIVRKPKQVSFRIQERIEELEKLGGKLTDNLARMKMNACNDQFETGTAGTNDCVSAWQVRVDSEVLCRFAAELDCPDTGSGHDCIPEFNFKVPVDNQSEFPPMCSIRANDSKWIYNPTGLSADQTDLATGTPVCTEKEYVNGTEGAATECPEHYSVIANETWCRSAAGCLNLIQLSEFRILDSDTQLTYPKGCYQNGMNVGYNPTTTDPTCSPDGTACVGAPLCNITNPTA